VKCLEWVSSSTNSFKKGGRKNSLENSADQKLESFIVTFRIKKAEEPAPPCRTLFVIVAPLLAPDQNF